jgi:hypothetical protein
MDHNDFHAARMLRRIMPELPLTDVETGIAYYRDVLGFSIIISSMI